MKKFPKSSLRAPGSHRRVLGYLAGAVLISSCPISASTVVYLPFDDGSDGTLLWNQGGDTADLAGTDDPFHTYADYTSPTYVSNVPVSVIPQTGAANTLSLDFSGNRDIYTSAAGPLVTGDYSSSSLTIQAYFQFDSLGGYQTILGRDDYAVEIAGSEALFYLQKTDSNVIRAYFATTGGDYVNVAGSTVLEAGQWYALAMVADISTGTVSLFLDNLSDGNGNYILDGSATGYDGLYDSTADQSWSIGRGYYGGNGDFVDGQIDEVTISDSALAMSEFMNVPEPSSALLGGCGLLVWLRRRRA
ncbi:hypothetical protein HNR46_000277 [Haloferula luteola]|uniref:PEP-CTERM protein-sorting domain-containing protein n=1 Tax=Haloferula luteola TaxID=595692 RepID=A0A840UZ00_9BACT|nr:LamG-like jellyroll fold domain-containing protein [Haloferula luteola]MBB5350056.1 hypothetical protein [Haloferula luteola]